MATDEKAHITFAVKAEAQRLGFSAYGASAVQPVDENAWRTFSQWIAGGNNADMHYLENYADKRRNPALLMDGAKSILSVALNYSPTQKLQDDQLQFAWYAYGKDYHETVKARLEELLHNIQVLYPQKHITGRAFCDTAPILERYWAWRSGLGWIGKNTLLIIPHQGSAFFLGELLLNIELDYDQPVKNRCGTCDRCLKACPGGALQSQHLDANRCLSYLTIENRGALPEWAKTAMGNSIYGCDRCQQVCPWNRFARPTTVAEFTPSKEFLQMTAADWAQLTPEKYRTLFKGSAVKRAKYEGLLRNILAMHK